MTLELFLLNVMENMYGIMQTNRFCHIGVSIFKFEQTFLLNKKKVDSGEECMCRVYPQSPTTCFLVNLTVGFTETVKWHYICCTHN